MSENGTEFTTPVGRVVWGHPSKVNPVTDNKTKAPKLNTQGQPRQEVSFGLAIPTADFQQYVWPYLAQETMSMYPNPPRDFAYKMTQEHELDKNNKPYGEREGYAGHVVLAIKTELSAPSVMKYNGRGGYDQMQPDEVKCGDYVRVGINTKVHAGESPGLYLNPLAVEFIGYGQPIKGGGYNVDPMAMFGGQQVALPAGASATPIGGAPATMGMPGMGQPQYAPQQGMPQMGNGGPPQQQAPMAAGMPGAAPAGGLPSFQTQPGQNGGYAAPMSPSNAPPQGMPGMGQPQQYMPPPATDFIPGAPQPQQGMGMPGQGGGMAMPGMPQR